MLADNFDLVSVFVETYNSASTVLDTLDSIYNQTYLNIELVISDDNSNDNTVPICETWTKLHQNRFYDVKIITSPVNTGVTANCKRAESACSGCWIKDMAADDIMLPNCIERYMEYIKIHPDTIYLFSKVEVFGERTELIDYFEKQIFDYSFFDLSYEDQMKWCVAGPPQPIPAASGFYNRKKTDELGIFYDERIPMLEDAPRWIQCIEKGIRFRLIDEILVKYRVSNSSICTGAIHYNDFSKSGALYYLLYKFPRNIQYVGKRKAYQNYILSMAKVSDGLGWKIGALVIRIMYYPYGILKSIVKKIK